MQAFTARRPNRQVRDLRHGRRPKIVNSSKPYSPVGIGHTTSRGRSRCDAPCRVSPHPSPLPWGEGEPVSAWRTIQTSRLSTARCALFPLPEGEDQGEGKRRELPSGISGPFPELSNWMSPPAEPEAS